MQSPLHVSDQALKPWAEESALLKLLRQWGIMLFLALRAKVTHAPVFGEMNQLFRNLGRLLNPGGGLVFWPKRRLAAWAFGKAVFFDFIELVVLKETTPESQMPLLAASLSGTGGFGFRWLDDIRGRGLGRSRGTF